jgi:hypothetical protein
MQLAVHGAAWVGRGPRLAGRCCSLDLLVDGRLALGMEVDTSERLLLRVSLGHGGELALDLQFNF